MFVSGPCLLSTISQESGVCRMACMPYHSVSVWLWYTWVIYAVALPHCGSIDLVSAFVSQMPSERRVLFKRPRRLP